MKSLYGTPELLHAGERSLPGPEQRQGFTDEQLAVRLWLNYFILTEEFDRTLPGRWSTYDRDTWLPASMSVSSRFASALERRTNEAIQCMQLHCNHVELRTRADVPYSLQVRLAQMWDKRYPDWTKHEVVAAMTRSPPPACEGPSTRPSFYERDFF